MFRLLRAAVAVAFVCSPAVASADDSPAAMRLGGTLLHPAPYAATVVIVPAGPRAPVRYDSLAEGLRERGFGSLLLDVGPKARSGAVAASVPAVRAATGSPCIWLLGHGAGGKAVLAAAEQASALCGVILVAPPGGGKTTRLAARLPVPLMVVSGGQDTDPGSRRGAALKAAQPAALHAVVLEMDRMLRPAAAKFPVISPKLVDLIGSFMLEKGPQVQGSLDPKESPSRGRRRAALEAVDAVREKS